MEIIRYTVADRIAYITINRPEKRNAMNFELVSMLKESFRKAENDPAVKVIVLKGEGEAFCAGADLEYLRQLQNNSREENLKDSTHLMELYHLIYTLKKIVIAQVNGHAIAGGCGLVSVCDFAFSIPEAHFGYTEVRIGFIPAIVMVFLIRKTGEAKARELLLSGKIYSSEEARHHGLINWICEEDELENAVNEFAKMLCTNNSSHSMMLTKQMISDVQSMPLKEALEYAAAMNADARSSDDCKKGIEGFLKKQKIKW